MQSKKPISVLTIGQDNLFAGLPGCEVDHVRTGRSITPRGTDAGPRRRLPAILTRLLLGKYDLIVLPAVDFRWAHDFTFAKRLVRSVLSNVLRFAPIRGCINWVLGRRARVIILDRYDSHDALVDYLRSVTSAKLYFKTNLQEVDNERVVAIRKGKTCRFKYLPYWIAIENYDVPPQAEKDFDVFFAGAVNSEDRVAAIRQVRELETEGCRIKIVEGHLPFAEYLSLMARSWLTLSPQGYGYNGFRHYESMLMGSIPLINLPEPAIVSDFRHGDNCFLYSTSRGDIADVIRAALVDKDRLRQIARDLRQYVVDHHSMSGVGMYLLRHALEPQEGADVEGDVPMFTRRSAPLTEARKP